MVKRVSEQSAHYAECEDCDEKFWGNDIDANTMEIEIGGEVIRLCFSCRKRRNKEERICPKPKQNWAPGRRGLERSNGE